MPDRPGLDDNESLNALIAGWRDGQADLDARRLAIWADIRRYLTRADADPEILGRLVLQVRRVEQLGADAASIVDDLATNTRRWINEGNLVQIYAAGADVTTAAVGTLPFQFTTPHRNAVEALSRDLFDDVLARTSYIDRDSKRWVRVVSRRLTGFKLTGGTPVKAQAARFERALRTEFERRGIGAVRYRDGSRHGFGEYAEMLLRTKTGVAYNAGTLNQGRPLGVQYYEILDGSLCGLTSHHDPELANGLIVPASIAAAYPLAHPSCRRALNPRFDVGPDDAFSTDRSLVAPESRIDQTAFERALAADRAQRSPGRSRRTRRPRRSRSRAGGAT